MNTTEGSPRRRGYWLILIGLSLLFLIAVVVLRGGVASTPYDTTDSSGRTMGFNDVFSREHYWILLQNFRISALFDWDFASGWCLLAMHAMGAWLIISTRLFGRKLTRWFFAAQPFLFLFPFGWIGFLILPFTVWAIFECQMDREGFVDIPFISCTAGPVWISVSLLIVFAMPGQSLDLKALFSSLVARIKILFRLAWRRIA